MEELIAKLKSDYPDLIFTAGATHCWSPDERQVFYTDNDESSSLAGLLHEIGHAQLKHTRFVSDIDLLNKEIDAWQEALTLSKQYNVDISEAHIENCLDTYRDWLYKRSRCPNCRSTGIQIEVDQYVCVNCELRWWVSSSRIKRPYRLTTKTKNRSGG